MGTEGDSPLQMDINTTEVSLCLSLSWAWSHLLPHGPHLARPGPQSQSPHLLLLD